MSDIFEGKKQVNKQKLRGGYYTPAPLCDYLVNWAIRTGDENILEPSCGNGNFITSALGKLNSLGALCDSTFVAVEISKEEMQVACSQATKVNHNNLPIHWYNDDFFHVYKILRCDLCLWRLRSYIWYYYGVTAFSKTIFHAFDCLFNRSYFKETISLNRFAR